MELRLRHMEAIQYQHHRALSRTNDFGPAYFFLTKSSATLVERENQTLASPPPNFYSTSNQNTQVQISILLLQTHFQTQPPPLSSYYLIRPLTAPHMEKHPNRLLQ